VIHVDAEVLADTDAPGQSALEDGARVLAGLFVSAHAAQDQALTIPINRHRFRGMALMSLVRLSHRTSPTRLIIGVLLLSLVAVEVLDIDGSNRPTPTRAAVTAVEEPRPAEVERLELLGSARSSALPSLLPEMVGGVASVGDGSLLLPALRSPAPIRAPPRCVLRYRDTAA
jgi:hypothetical protein